MQRTAACQIDTSARDARHSPAPDGRAGFEASKIGLASWRDSEPDPTPHHPSGHRHTMTKLSDKLTVFRPPRGIASTAATGVASTDQVPVVAFGEVLHQQNLSTGETRVAKLLRRLFGASTRNPDRPSGRIGASDGFPLEARRVDAY
jgi:hypothetical protein